MGRERAQPWVETEAELALSPGTAPSPGLPRACRVGTGESGVVLCGGIELLLPLELFMG